MIDLTERYEVIKSVCESLKLQTKPELRIKSKRQVIISHTVKTRRIPKWCIDRVPSDAQIIGETELHYLVRH
ncbi:MULTISPECIES: hypothetical protein [Citrobacter freundii complex]|uniref:hypothetical protein n=1 Tax=Citrobacter freundii complex TaxID=1344959 RepID=UPI001C63F675|nr:MULTISPECIES: hypothetical protein [Citrobacter freundii complex]ELG4626931.1 hypothetical protein [Citrobacter koseri]ELO6185260.1 hypothetical protein [Escherichia coli]HED2193303.1 hypothetical protein [Citrobacter freundii]MBW7621520.1 hypothetical protein [Citrobacter portucalensis]MBW7640504.1 hypothetical protein [Citrobacter portucalensis]